LASEIYNTLLEISENIPNHAKFYKGFYKKFLIMGQAIVTLKVMPESVEINLSDLEKEITHVLAQHDIKVSKIDREPIAFGLLALNVIFLMDENKGDTETLENACKSLKGVMNAEVTDMRRSF